MLLVELSRRIALDLREASCFRVIVDDLSKASELEACLSRTIHLYELKLASSA